MKRTDNTDNLVLTALMMGLVCLATFALKVPNPLTQGYVHLGDTFIFMSVLVLGKKNGAIASSVGAALADIFGGYVVFAAGTFVAKGLMAYVMGEFIQRGRLHEDRLAQEAASRGETWKPRLILSLAPYELLAMITGGLVEVVIYIFVNAIVYGNMAVGFVSVPGNTGQFICSMIVAVLLTHALLKTPARKFFRFVHR